MSKPLAVLIVEDSESDAQLIVRLLTKAGYSLMFERIETAEQMRAALEKQAWDMVISDYSLPELDGPTALTLLQETGLDIPFIVVSGTMGEETVVDVMKAGAHDCVMKGNLARLAPAVERELSQAESRRARRQANIALRESEERYRRLAGNALDIVYRFEITPSYRVAYINSVVKDITGYTPDEFYADPDLPGKLVYPDDFKTFERIGSDGKGIGDLIPLRIVRKDGQVIWLEMRNIPVQDEIGRIVAFEGMVRDITEHKRAEEKLTQSHELLANLARLVPSVIYQYRLYPDGRSAFPYSSPGMNDIYEVTPEEVREDASPVFGRLHPDDYDCVANAIQESARTLQEFYCEFRVILPRQGLRWRWSQAHPERTGDGGTLWHGIISDITGRKNAENELLKTKILLQASIESPQGMTIMAIDKNYQYLCFNKTHVAAMQSAYGKDVKLGLNALECITSEEDREKAKRNYDRAMSGESHSTIEVYGDVERAYYESFYNPIFNELHEIIGITAFAMDITERVQAQEEIKKLNTELEERVEERTRELRDIQEQLVHQEKLAALGQLAGGVSHELRNPLGVINNAIYYLRMVQPDAGDNVRQYHAMIEQEIQNAEKIMKDMLNYARGFPADREPVAIADLVQGVLKRRPAPPSVEVVLSLPVDLPKVYADSRQVEQVLGNLTVNACQAMPNGGKLTITANRQKEMVAIVVQDTGTGITPEHKQKLFEPLFTTKANGIGLGLAISKKLAEANGGRIDVESEVGKGSTFTVYLPVQENEL